MNTEPSGNTLRRELHQMNCKSEERSAYPIKVYQRILQWVMRLTYTDESTVEQGVIFKSNRSQAVRLQRSVALPDVVKRVDVVAVGRAHILTPVGESWDSWFDGEGVSPDFMSERERPGDQGRERL